jgi:hypothetical protein
VVSGQWEFDWKMHMITPLRRLTNWSGGAGLLALPLVVLLAWAPVSSAGPIIDRVLAVVSGTILTLSDVHAAIGLGLVHTEGAEDPVAAGLEQLIERALMLTEVERYAPPEPDAAALEARVRGLRSRFPSEEQLERALAAYGITEARLRGIARDDLRLQAYLAQRFAASAPVRDEEVLAYYRERAAEFTRDGVPQPLSEVDTEIRDRLDRQRRAALIDEWTRGLRRRAEVTVLYLPR